jgi:hypothetical protein
VEDGKATLMMIEYYYLHFSLFDSGFFQPWENKKNCFSGEYDYRVALFTFRVSLAWFLLRHRAYQFLFFCERVKDHALNDPGKKPVSLV